MSTEDFGTSMPQLPCENQKEEEMEKLTADTILDLIRSKLEDPRFEAHELSRLVTAAIVTLAVRMQRLGSTVEESYIRRRLYRCIELLRKVQRSIIDTDKFRQGADGIFWEGEAIKKVVYSITGWFIESMKQAGLTETEQDLVIRYYRDLASRNQPQLRRETKR